MEKQYWKFIQKLEKFGTWVDYVCYSITATAFRQVNPLTANQSKHKYRSIKITIMYYLCKFSDSWSVYDAKSNSSRQLKSEEVESLKTIFPALLNNGNKILTAIKIEAINPNKLLQLTLPEKGVLNTTNGR